MAMKYRCARCEVDMESLTEEELEDVGPRNEKCLASTKHEHVQCPECFLTVCVGRQTLH